MANGQSEKGNQSLKWAAILVVAIALIFIVAKLFGGKGLLKSIWGGVEETADWTRDGIRDVFEWTGDRFEDGMHSVEHGAEEVWDWMKDVDFDWDDLNPF